MWHVILIYLCATLIDCLVGESGRSRGIIAQKFMAIELNQVWFLRINKNKVRTILENIMMINSASLSVAFAAAALLINPQLAMKVSSMSQLETDVQLLSIDGQCCC